MQDMKKLTFDIMVGEKFYRTMHMPIAMDMVIDYQGEQPIIDGEKIKEWVLQNALRLNTTTLKFAFKRDERFSIYITHRTTSTT